MKILASDPATVFDLLTRPGPELSSAERNQVKKVAHLLLGKLKDLLTFNWRQTTQGRARVREAIGLFLDGLPHAHTEPIYKEKCARLFEHVHETYLGAGNAVGVRR